MAITVNGDPHRVPPDLTVRELLDLLGVRGTAAVEHNRRIVPRAEHATTRLAEGDALEVVQLVGGG
jgi:thiamine biosynthesis protein ThiS